MFPGLQAPFIMTFAESLVADIWQTSQPSMSCKLVITLTKYSDNCTTIVGMYWKPITIEDMITYLSFKRCLICRSCSFRNGRHKHVNLCCLLFRFELSSISNLSLKLCMDQRKSFSGDHCYHRCGEGVCLSLAIESEVKVPGRRGKRYNYSAVFIMF